MGGWLNSAKSGHSWRRGTLMLRPPFETWSCITLPRFSDQYMN